jgi:plastocyanin
MWRVGVLICSLFMSALVFAVKRPLGRGIPLTIWILAAAIVLGCDKQEELLPSRPGVPAGKGIVSGIVRFFGSVPKAAPIADADCHLGGPPLVDESLVVDDAGGMRNVIVYIKDAPAVNAASPPVVMDQAYCRFSPHVVAVQTGQALRFHSSDSVPHNVHGQCEANASFNFMMAAAGQSREITFRRPEVFQVRCDVHPWMNGYVAVFDHPLFAVTDERGRFRIEHVPPGKYTLVAWQERLGTVEQPLTVTDAPVSADFEFSARR